jgi:hypothetical protein
MSHHIYDEHYIEIPPENTFSIISNYENNETHPINNLENTRHSQYNSNQINNSLYLKNTLIPLVYIVEGYYIKIKINQVDALQLYSTLKRQIIKIPTCSSCAEPQNRFQISDRHPNVQHVL